MQRADVERLFQMACAAFPHGEIGVFDGGMRIMSRGADESVELLTRFEMRKEASVFSHDGLCFYLVRLPLPPSFIVELRLSSDDYSSAAVPMRMLDTLASAAFRCGGVKHVPVRQFLRVGENSLLNSLLYTDTLETKVYTFLLAEEQGKDLSIPRVVCVVNCGAGVLREAADIVARFRYAACQDICGVTSDERLVICRCLDGTKRSVKSQLKNYLGALSERIHQSCGFRPEIWAGTYAEQPEEYRLSLEAALIAGEWGASAGDGGGIRYASEYILEYTFQKTDPAYLRHFLEPYAVRLRLEPELAKTAEALIESDMNIILAAKKMFMHRNTVTMRAERLWKLLGINPQHRDCDKFLLMLLCAYNRRYN